MPDSRKWFLVGDLIQGIGTVVIGGDEGNMNKYFDSLRKVILLNPGIILPSHGIALGSTFRLQKTLEHRQMRENQILKLSKLKMNPDEMVDELYQNLATGMKKYALSNVLKHLDKLRDEKKI